jgi:hypothetical protein
LKIVVLNDLHPSQQGGAASIALQNARFLATENQVEYWCTSTGGRELPVEASLKLRIFRYGRFKKLFQENLRFAKMYFEFFDLRITFRCLTEVVRFKPDLVWVHQIGNGLPKSITFAFRILRIPTVQTFHDYSLLVPGKLFPSHFGWSNSEVDMLVSKMESGELKTPRLQTSNLLSSVAIKLRFKLLRKLAMLNSRNILVGPQQERIFSLFGLENTTLLPNITSNCICPDLQESKVSGDLRILFAGRPAGKGLGKISRLVQNTPRAHLDLAGDMDLLNYLPFDFPESKFTFLGRLEHSELLGAIHNYDYVSVLSECFDVYPSILIEALEHSSRVLCTSTVGNHSAITSDQFGYQLAYDLDVNKISLTHLINEQNFHQFASSPTRLPMGEKQYQQELLRIANDAVKLAR